MNRLASEQYRRQQRRALRAALAVRGEWAQMGNDLDAGWRQIGQRITLLVTAAQIGAATDAAAFVSAAVDVDPVAQLKPRGFAGLAADGRTLETLLYGAVVTARTADATSLTQRLEIGRKWLETVVQTTVADAARDAQQVAVVARPRVQWVRVVNAPCCQRCAILSGRVYRWSQGFDRHPRCDCTMLPQTVADPDAGGLIGPENVTDLTRLQREAIAGGADFNRVVNTYNRDGAYHLKGYLPPSRVTRDLRAAKSRTQAQELMQSRGLLIA